VSEKPNECERHRALKKVKVEAHSTLEIGERIIHLCNECAYQFVEHMKTSGQKMDTKKIGPKIDWGTLMTLDQGNKKELT
jgi:hypothetical protein